jgi:branched-subunit amino acid ABC-type transport system permease component
MNIRKSVRQKGSELDALSKVVVALLVGAMILLPILIRRDIVSHAVVLNGLSRSMLLFIIASGLTLVFGLMGVVNFAHGAFYALGGYFAVVLLGFQDSFWIALFIAPFLVAFLGIIVEFTTIRPLYDREPVYGLLLTFGLAIVIEEGITGIFGPDTRGIRIPELLSGVSRLLFGPYPRYRLFIIGVGIVLLVVLWAIFQKTRVGIIIRAGTYDSEMTDVLGINTRRVFTGVFGFGVALAAVAGIIAGPMFSVSPTMGVDILIDAFIVVIIGGLGSIRGSFVGALIVGFTQSFGSFYFDQYVAPLIFAVLIVVLVLRPTGLFGQPGIFEH